MARMSREKSAFAGLSSAEAEKRLAKYGENILSNKKADALRTGLLFHYSNILLTATGVL